MGLKEAGNLLSTSSADHKIIITITDGVPTLSYRNPNLSNPNKSANIIVSSPAGYNIPVSAGSSYPNHGVPTIETATALMNNYDLFAIGLGLSAGDSTMNASPTDVKGVINGITSGVIEPGHDLKANAYMSDTVQELKDALWDISNKLSNSVMNGSIDDPMGEYFKIAELTLADDFDLTNGNYYLSGNKPGLTSGVTVVKEGQTLKIKGLYFGEDETLSIRYKIQMDTEAAGFVPGVFYPTNGTTILTPVGDDSSTSYEFPEPEAFGNGITIQGEKFWQGDEGIEALYRPESITVALMRDVNDVPTEVEEIVVTPNSEGKWTYYFEDALWYDSSGEFIEFYVKDDVGGYTSVPGGLTRDEFGNITYNITNVFALTSSIQLEKIADKSELVVNDEITYTFNVTNTGEMPISNIILEDNLVGLGPISYLTLDGNPITDLEHLVLAPGAVLIAEAAYTVTQLDVNRGFVLNEASVSGIDPKGSLVEDETDHTILGEINLGIDLEKTADKITVSTAGEELLYTFTITNIGNVTLTDVTLNDPMLGGNIVLDKTTLDPNEVATASVIYEVTQADVDRGYIDNKATVIGNPYGFDAEDPSSPQPQTAEDEVQVLASSNPTIKLDKVADKDYITLAGEVVTYTFTVTNTGNVTLTDIVVNDPLVGGSVTLLKTELAPGESTTGTGQYTVTQLDVEGISRYNQAETEGTPPNHDPSDPTSPAKVFDDADLTIPTLHNPLIQLEKVADVAEVRDVGAEVIYTFTITNVGNVTLNNVTLDDAMLGGAITIDKTTLAPGESATGSQGYLVTQADLDAGKIENTAIAKGYGPAYDPADPTSSGEVTSQDVAVVLTDDTPLISLVKTSDKLKVTTQNEKVIYTFVITNKGNVTLYNLVIYDEMLGGEILVPITSLAPQDSYEFDIEYTVTIADLQLEKLINEATVEAKDIQARVVTDTDVVTIEVEYVSPPKLPNTGMGAVNFWLALPLMAVGSSLVVYGKKKKID